MISQVQVRHLALALLFTFCQVSGTMCVSPDLTVAEGISISAERSIACPMDETIMCPPVLASPPERPMQHSMATDVDYKTIPITSDAVPNPSSIPAQRSWSSAVSIVPISIESSSVLRI